MSIKGILTKAGIDGAVGFTILTRIIQAAGGLISIAFIAKFLSPKEQGYYYTFASILAIQVFFELGLSGIITQYTAHEFAHLQVVNGELLGDAYFKSRLSSLLRFCVKWFGVLSIFLFLLLIAVGFYFFDNFNKGTGVNWENPWALLCISTSLNLFIDPVLAFIDGLGDVRDMAKVRLIQKTTNIVLLFLFFSLGFKLYSSALASSIAVVVNYLQINFSEKKQKLKAIWKLRDEWSINYLNEIFPFQWRIALSWISGYFIFQLFNPVLFAFDGPIVAGQMGMSLQILNGIASLSMSLIVTKIPLFSSLIAQKNYEKLNTAFNQALKSQMFINLSIICLFYLSYLTIYFDKITFSQRFLPPVPFAMLSIATIVNQIIFSWATYLRCHKQEPFLINSIVIGLICAASTFFLGKYWGMIGIVSGYSAVTVAIGLPWAYYIFKTKKYLWHIQTL